MLIVLGLVFVDVVIASCYTALEGFIAGFNVGREPHREKPRNAIGVSEKKCNNVTVKASSNRLTCRNRRLILSTMLPLVLPDPRFDLVQ